MRIPANRIQVKVQENPMRPGEYYRKLVKNAWGKLYRSCDGGNSWHRTSSEAFWAAFHAGKLVPMTAPDVEYLQNGGIELA